MYSPWPFPPDIPEGRRGPGNADGLAAALRAGRVAARAPGRLVVDPSSSATYCSPSLRWSPPPDQTRVRSGLSGHNPDLTRGLSAIPRVY
jgi:hypothetical protein